MASEAGLAFTKILIFNMLKNKPIKNGHDPKVMPVVFIGGVPRRAATIAMLSENARCAFYGRGTPRPYEPHYLYFTTVIVFTAPFSAVRRKR